MKKQFFAAAFMMNAALYAQAGTVVYSSNGTTVTSTGNSIVVVNGQVISGNGKAVMSEGPVQTEQRNTDSYTGVILDAPVNFTYTVATAASMKITAPENILPLVTTKVVDRHLVIGIKEPTILTTPIEIVATGPNLASFWIAGSGNVQASGLSGTLLRLKISGSGSISAAGQVDAIVAEISGSGGIDASRIQAADVTANVSGSGSIQAYASRSIKADASGSGGITITGSPPQRSVNRSGSGQVTFK